MSKPFEVKITRADKRNRKIILVLESDIFSHETFAMNPFYDDGDEKNQLQNINFVLKVKETKGAIEANVAFASTYHFTRGHRQLHSPISTFYRERKDCARAWVRESNVSSEYYADHKVSLLKHWSKDTEFIIELKSLLQEKERKAVDLEIESARDGLQTAIKRLGDAVDALKETNKD